MLTDVNPWLGYRRKKKGSTTSRGPSWTQPAHWSDPVIRQISLAAQRAFDLYDEVDLRVETEPLEYATVILTCAVSDTSPGTPEVHGKAMTGAQRLSEILKILHQPLPTVPSRKRRSRQIFELPMTSTTQSPIKASSRELHAQGQSRVEIQIAGLSRAQGKLIQDQVERLEAPAPILWKPSEVALLAGVPAVVLEILARLTSLPVFQIAGVALVGFAVVTAVAKSPALARIVSHPVFAWFSLLIAAIDLVPWSITQAMAASASGPSGVARAVVQLIAIPAVSAVGVAIGVRSLTKGVLAAQEMRPLTWKIGALDAATARLSELEEDLKKLQGEIVRFLSKLDEHVPPEDHPKQISDILRKGGALEKASAAVKRAMAILKDLRDERPMRIAAAEHSSREAQHEFAPDKAEQIQHEIRNAEANAKAALRGALERVEELRSHPALQLLADQLQARVSHLDTRPPGEQISEVRSRARYQQVLLEKIRKGCATLSALVALTVEPGGSSRVRRQHRRGVARFLREHAEYGELVDRIEAQTFDAVRVVQASPRYWVNEARGKPTLTQREKTLQRTVGFLAFPVLLWTFIIAAMAEITVTVLVPVVASRGKAVDVTDLLATCAAGLLAAASPFIVLYLSNVRLGSYAFNVAPLLHEQISTKSEAGFYADPENAALCIARAEKVIRPLPPREAKDYVTTSIENIKRMLKTLARLEHLEIPAGQVERVQGAEWEQLKALSLLLRSVPETAVKRAFDHVTEDRPYRYDAHEPRRPEDRRARRAAVKRLPFDKLRSAFEEGKLTNRDIWNMIQDHPSAQEGSVFPRDILRGKLSAAIAHLVDEADAQGVFRPFIGVKDLFGGLDGAANAGSKVTHIADMPSAELIKRLRTLGFLPIPVGMSAGANAGTGLENGHSAVGNPLHRGYDTGGSSSSCAYLLGLEDFPVHLYIGTDTGGSVSAPIGALQKGCAYITKWIPRGGMLPYSTTLDTIGVMGLNQDEVLKTALSLISSEHIDLHLTPSKAPPVYYVFKSDLELPLLKQNDPLAKEVVAKFTKVVHRLDAAGRVKWLDARYDGWREFPLDSYRVSFVEALYALFNPAQKNRYGEPTRVVLDSNLQNRMGRALVLLRHVLRLEVARFGQMRLAGKSLFQIFRELRNAYSKLHEEKWPKNAVLLQPSPIPVKLDEFRTGGEGGSLTDDHDRTGMQKQIQFGWDQFISGDDGYVVTGRPEYVLHVVMAKEAASERWDSGISGNFEAATQMFKRRLPQAGPDDRTMVMMTSRSAARGRSR